MIRSRARLICRIENNGAILNLISLPMNPDNDEINRAYQRIKDLRILEIIDLAEQLELISQVYKHTTQTPYQARHNVSQQ